MAQELLSAASARYRAERACVRARADDRAVADAAYHLVGHAARRGGRREVSVRVDGDCTHRPGPQRRFACRRWFRVSSSTDAPEIEAHGVLSPSIGELLETLSGVKPARGLLFKPLLREPRVAVGQGHVPRAVHDRTGTFDWMACRAQPEDGAGGACAAVLQRCLHAVRPVLAKHGAAARVEQLAVFEHAHSRLHRVESCTAARENRATSFERGSKCRGVSMNAVALDCT